MNWWNSASPLHKLAYVVLCIILGSMVLSWIFIGTAILSLMGITGDIIFVILMLGILVIAVKGIKKTKCLNCDHSWYIAKWSIMQSKYSKTCPKCKKEIV